MATAFDLGGLLGPVFGGGELDDLLTPQQRQAIQTQSLLSAASALLQAGGPSRTPISLGQALGGALEAGQAGAQRAQQSALTQMLTRQKLEEARRQREADQALRNMLLGGGEAMTPAQALAAPGMAAGPTRERAAMIGQVAEPAGAFGGLSLQQRQLLAALPPAQAAAEGLKLLQPPAPSDKAKLLRELNLPVTIENLRLLEKPEAAPEKIRTLQALGLEPTIENLRQLEKPDAAPEKIRTLQALGLEPTIANLRQLEKPDASPSEIRILEATGTPVTLQNVMNLRRSGATTVNIQDMTGGQKGFENEMKLASAFKGEPIYKEFQGMRTAFNQVNNALDAGTPIGDLAGATKIMKLMDEGSVVRETELAMAMAASGRMDRLRNYFSLWASGNKLTPTQREDFKALSNELYSAAAQAYNAKRDEYKGFGSAYNFKNLDAALGAPATMPSIIRRNLPASGISQSQGGEQRRPLSEIFRLP
jgi:hypothetical protein